MVLDVRLEEEMTNLRLKFTGCGLSPAEDCKKNHIHTLHEKNNITKSERGDRIYGSLAVIVLALIGNCLRLSRFIETSAHPCTYFNVLGQFAMHIPQTECSAPIALDNFLAIA